MKNFGRLFYAAIIFMVASASLSAANTNTLIIENAEDLKEFSLVANSFEGSWDYTVSDVPYEYKTGVLLISKKKEEYVVEVKLQYGTIKATDVSLKKNKMNFSVWVEGEKVDVSLTIKEDELTGKAKASIGEMTLMGKRSEA